MKNSTDYSYELYTTVILTKNKKAMKFLIQVLDSKIDFLYNLLLDMKFVYVSSHSSYVLPVVYWIVGKLYGIKGDLHKTLKIAHMGINYCHKNSSIKNLGQLYYHVSYTSYLLKDFDESKKYAIKAICAFIANEDDKITQIYLNIMKKDFGVDPLTYLNIKSIDELK